MNNNQNINNENNDKNIEKPKTKIGIQILLVAVILLVVLSVVFSFADLPAIIELIKNANLSYILLSLGLALGGYILISVANYIPMITGDRQINKANAFLISSTENFFNGITPFGSGAQPFQVYYMVKEGVKPNRATSVIMVNFIIYQVIITILATFSIIFYYNEIYLALGINIIYLFIGYTLNTIILLALITLSLFNKSYVLFEKLIKLLGKIKFLKKRSEKWLDGTKEFIDNFQAGFKFLLSKKRVAITSVILKLIGLLLSYSTIIFLVRALGYNLLLSNYIYLIFISMLAFTVMIWIPLPGSSGGIEWIFTLLLLPVFPGEQAIVLSLMLLWRLITYYFAMLYGGISYLLLVRRGKKVK